MKLHPTFGKTPLKRALQGLRLALAATVAEESSRPGELHPQALTDPYMSLSAHTALIVQPLRRVAQANGRRVLDRAKRSCGSNPLPAGDVA